MTELSLSHHQPVVCASWGSQYHAVSLSWGQPQGEVAGRAKSYFWCVFWSWLWEMSTRVIRSHWNHRAVRHIYQIGPRLMWQKQHVLLVNKPIGVNTTQAAHELQWRSVYFARNRRRRFFWHFSLNYREKNLTTELTWYRKKRKQLLETKNTPLKNQLF